MGSDPLEAPADWGALDRLATSEQGGDPACWLSRVCPSCGPLNEGPGDGSPFCDPQTPSGVPGTEDGAQVTWTTVCEFRDLPVGTPVAVIVDGDAICVVRAGGEVFAVHDQCTHAAVPLSEGDVDGATIECWMHGSRFDLRTGAALNLPATTPVKTYPVRRHDGHVQVSQSSPDPRIRPTPPPPATHPKKETSCGPRR